MNPNTFQICYAYSSLVKFSWTEHIFGLRIFGSSDLRLKVMSSSIFGSSSVNPSLVDHYFIPFPLSNLSYPNSLTFFPTFPTPSFLSPLPVFFLNLRHLTSPNPPPQILPLKRPNLGPSRIQSRDWIRSHPRRDIESWEKVGWNRFLHLGQRQRPHISQLRRHLPQVCGQLTGGSISGDITNMLCLDVRLFCSIKVTA